MSDDRISINIRVSVKQSELIDLGVKEGYAFNRAAYIRKAIDQLNEKVLALIEIDKLKSENERLKKKIEEFQDK